MKFKRLITFIINNEKRIKNDKNDKNKKIL